ncbi:MAG: GPW/gp25 family protein [bacterium]
MFLTNRDHFAYDLSKNIETRGEIWDTDVINQSIEMIIATYFGERIFNPNFGSKLLEYLFGNIDKNNGEQLLDSIIESIKTFEDRVSILEADARLILDHDNNSVILKIPYIILKQNLKSTFEKKIIL